MKIIGAFVVTILAIILYIILCKVVSWIYDFDKKTDVKMFKMELRNYDNDKKCAIASITIVFLVITVWILIYIFTS